ncbi:hypothetical protein CPLU01_07599 [Colletotrichum plurivorum]|uniref:NACHT-NTPase and P-loop NTPases N-terminal domain-containing protein n=1 Tax=Colletotrichum plurivorum TaxID=2175906 RepID=A0A8H6NE36_9PEZI|nr:hypothetical protein CPLU01_07599 [Colletotrichum plurivorum]
MSGAEVIGLVSGIVGIVDAIIKFHDAVQDAAGLPGAFREVANRMPLLRDTMLAVQHDLGSEADPESAAALKQALEGCREKSQALEKIFGNVAVAPEASRAQRYFSAVRTFGKGRKLEELMSGIQADMQLLAANYTIKASTRARVVNVIQDLEISEESPRERPRVSVGNYGSGAQSIHAGNGDQNLNIGSGTQLSGSFQGPFHITTSE